MCFFICQQRSRIVASNFIDTCSEWRRTVVFPDDDVRISCESSFEIGSHRCDENQEEVFLRRMHTHLCACSYKQRPYIKCRTALIRRYESLVKSHHFLHHLDKELCRHLRHKNAAACTLQPGCILVGPEHPYFPIRTSVSFQPFESLLSIMKACCRHVEWYSLLAANLNLSPFSVAEIATYVIISFAIAKSKIGPIQIFSHIIHIYQLYDKVTNKCG